MLDPRRAPRTRRHLDRSPRHGPPGRLAPYVPVSIGAHGDRFVTGPGSRKARNLRRDPRMTLSIAPVDNPITPVVVRERGERPDLPLRAHDRADGGALVRVVFGRLSSMERSPVAEVG